MSNFEMSEFEKELDAKIKSSEIMEESYKNGCIVSYFVSFKDIVSTFKDWQPPKPLVKIPQFMADWFEYQLKNNNDLDKFGGNDIFRIIQDVIKVSNDESTWEDYGITDEIAKFAEDNEELFLNLIVNCSFKVGYTVDKEKLFYLKSKMTGRYLRSYTGLGMDDTTLRYEEVDDRRACGFGGGTTFTQFEIDEMETGSYEQIEVEE